MRNKKSSHRWLMIPINVLFSILLITANCFLAIILISPMTFMIKYDIPLSVIIRPSKECIIRILICVLTIGIDISFVVYRVIKKRNAKIKRLAKEQKCQEKENYKISIQNHLDSLSRKEIGKIDFSNIPYKYLPKEYHWAKQKQEQEERSGVSRRTVKLEDLLQ